MPVTPGTPGPPPGLPGSDPHLKYPHLFLVENFESDPLSSVFDAQIGSTASLDTTHAHSGTQSLLIHQTGTAAGSIRTLWYGAPVIVGRFWFWCAAPPAVTLQIAAVVAGVNCVFNVATSGILAAGFTGSTASSTVQVCDGAWHSVDFRVDYRAALGLCDFIVDATPHAQVNLAVTGVPTQFKVANSGATTVDYWIDDIQLSDNWSEYPLTDPAPPTPPRTQQVVQVLDQAPFFTASRYDSQRRGLVLEPSVQRAAASAPAAPTATPLPKQTVIQASARTALQTRTRSHVIIGRPAADAAIITPRASVVVDAQPTRPRRWSRVIAPSVQLAAASAPAAPTVTPPRPVLIQSAQPRQRRHAATVQNRWVGYQWVGLPAILPLPKQVVQDQAALQTSRLERRRGQVIAPPVQISAASGTTPPPFTGPFPRPVVIMMRPATPRSARSGHVIQARTLTAPIAPPRPTVVDLCPATTPRRPRGGHVVVGRPVALPGLRPRPVVIQRAAGKRARRGGVWVEGPQMAVFGASVAPSTLITTPATGYVTTGDTGVPAAGSSGRPGVGDTGTIKAGLSGQVRI